MLPLVADVAHALPCRPTVACTADIVPEGSFELEGGFLSRKLDGARQITTPLLAKATVTARLQLQLGDNGLTFLRGGPRASYLDDVALGAKYHLVDQDRVRPSISLSLHALVPTFAAHGYLRTFDAVAIVYATKDFAWLHADANAGLGVLRLDDPLAQPFAALALSAPLAGPASVMVEGYAFARATPVAEHDGGLLFALALAPAPWLVVDVGGDAGAYPSVRAYAAFVGFTVLLSPRATLPP